MGSGKVAAVWAVVRLAGGLFDNRRWDGGRAKKVGGQKWWEGDQFRSTRRMEEIWNVPETASPPLCVRGMGVRCTPWYKRRHHHHPPPGLRSRKIPPDRRNFTNGRALIGWQPVKQPQEGEIPDG